MVKLPSLLTLHLLWNIPRLNQNVNLAKSLYFRVLISQYLARIFQGFWCNLNWQVAHNFWQHLRSYISFRGIVLLSIWLNKPRQLRLLFSPGVANILPQCAILYEPSLNHVTPRNHHLRRQYVMTKWQFLAAQAALYIHIWDSLINL